MNRPPLWLVLVAWLLGALACGLFGFALIRSTAIVLLDALRVIAP